MVRETRGAHRHIRKLIDIQPPVERAILVGAARRRNGNAIQLDEHLDELARLADTAGATVVGRVVQRLDAPTPNYFIGPGKVRELVEAAKSSSATLVVFDEQLSPAQGKNLEAALDLRVMDRTELILDIFATRAKSKEAQLEVELAQLEYLLPRLQRMWVHLSRIRGGIGLRGPGETQLETDRRMIRRKISTLRGKLEAVARQRQVVRHRRHTVRTAAIVGYTNAGKSSLLKALTGTNAFIEDRLFATLDTLTREISVNGGARLRMVDTVGFIRKLPHELVASFRATLDEARGANMLIHVIDASHPAWEEQVDAVDGVLAELVAQDTPVVHAFNKMDRVTDPDAFLRMVAARHEHSVGVTATRGDVGALLAKLGTLVSPGSTASPAR